MDYIINSIIVKHLFDSLVQASQKHARGFKIRI